MNFDELEQKIIEIQQPRTNFQIRNFVIRQHATPEMQYRQTLIELQDLIFKYKTAQIEAKKIQLKIQGLELLADDLSMLEADQERLNLLQTQLALSGAEKEILELIKIYDEFEHKYTLEEIESGQQAYWQERLTNNANAMILGSNIVSYAHIEAMQQAGVLEEFIESMEKSRKPIE